MTTMKWRIATKVTEIHEVTINHKSMCHAWSLACYNCVSTEALLEVPRLGTLILNKLGVFVTNLELPTSQVVPILTSLFLQYFCPFLISLSILEAWFMHWKNIGSKQARVYVLPSLKS